MTVPDIILIIGVTTNLYNLNIQHVNQHSKAYTLHDIIRIITFHKMQYMRNLHLPVLLKIVEN